SRATQLAFSRDGKTLGILAGGEVHLFDTAAGKVARTLNAPPPRLPLQLGVTGRTAFAVIGDEKRQRKTVLRWDLATRQEIGRGAEVPATSMLVANGDVIAELRSERGLRYLDVVTLEARHFVPRPPPGPSSDQVIRAD